MVNGYVSTLYVRWKDVKVRCKNNDNNDDWIWSTGR